MKHIAAFLKIPLAYSRRKSALFVALSFATSLTEGIGLFLLIPLLSVVAGVGSENEIVMRVTSLIEAIGLPIDLYPLMGAFLALLLARSLFLFFASLTSSRIKMEIVDDMRVKTFDALQHANWAWLSDKKTSDQTNGLITEIERISAGIQGSFSFLSSSFRASIYIFVSFTLSFWITLVALCFGLLLAAVLQWQRKATRRLGEKLAHGYQAQQLIVDEGLRAIKLSKIHQKEAAQTSQLSKIFETLRQASLSQTRVFGLAKMIFDMSLAAFVVVFVILGINWFGYGPISLAVICAIILRVAPIVQSLQRQNYSLLNTYPALEIVTGMVEQAIINTDGSNVALQPEIPFLSAIRFKKVTFRYPTRSLPSLDEISVEIPARRTIAVIGPSGSGKSTFADMLMGLIFPQSGEITIDGRVLSNQDIASWRAQISYVAQDVFLFHRSIRENLLWANPTASEQELKSSLKTASAEFVFDLPQGIETIVGDHGAVLSGGERQRVAMARALLQKPKLLILDEATSALDPENDKKIRAAIKSLHGEMTIVIISHKQEALDIADHVVPFEGGKILQQEQRSKRGGR